MPDYGSDPTPYPFLFNCGNPACPICNPEKRRSTGKSYFQPPLGITHLTSADCPLLPALRGKYTLEELLEASKRP